MQAPGAHSSSPRASACGIPASTLLSVLDHDKAYSYLDACTVHRVPVFLFPYRFVLSDHLLILVQYRNAH